MSDRDHDLGIICARYRGPADHRAEGSALYQCSECHQLVWLAPAGQALQRRESLKIVCLPCALPDIRDAKVPIATAEELNRHLGTHYTPEQLEAWMKRVVGGPDAQPT